MFKSNAVHVARHCNYEIVSFSDYQNLLVCYHKLNTRQNSTKQKTITTHTNFDDESVQGILLSSTNVQCLLYIQLFPIKLVDAMFQLYSLPVGVLIDLHLIMRAVLLLSYPH